MVTTAPPIWASGPEDMASAVIAAPSSPDDHAPEVMMTRPVNDTTMMVSMNVWVIDTSPWRTGCTLLAAAATIAAEPSPDSLENRPRATPNCSAIATVEPTNPPVAAVPVNASVKISAKASGMAATLAPRTTRPAST